MVVERVVLAARPKGEAGPEHFRLEQAEMPAPGEDEVLVKVSHLSLDPYMRGRMSDAKSYADPVAVDAVMTGQGGGTIITISSGAAHGPVEAWSHYCASKAGAAMLTRCADKEGRDHGIRAMGLSPGTVATQMQREIKSSGINPVSRLDWSDHIPPEWVATALMWMCGPAGDAHLGEELSLRDEDWRRQLGLVE